MEQVKVFPEAAQPEKVYKVPNLTVDAIVTKKLQERDHILLITRGRPPFEGHYAFPGGFVDYGEDPEDACIRELKEECTITGHTPELVCVAGKPDRDPRKHVVSVVYHVEVDPNHEVKAGDDAASAKWYDLEEVKNKYEMAFDHKEILIKFINKFKQ